MKQKTKVNRFFLDRVKRKLEREGCIVTEVNEKSIGFELIRTDHRGETAGIRVKKHGHIYKPERKKLLQHDIPVYIASEQYSGDSSVHAIKVVKIIGGE